MTVAIVTDSAAALPDDLAAKWGIVVVPMRLDVGGVPELEGARPLSELLDVGDVRTAAPSPGEFSAAAARGLETAPEVVVLTVAGSMSATYDAARLGCAALGPAVHVVDTRSAAGGQALVVLAAARAASEDVDGTAVAARAREVAAMVRLVATLPDLDHLVRGGRVPGVAAWAGKQLRINPVFEFRDGGVRTLRPALSRAAALDRIVAHVRRSARPGARLHAAVLHAGEAATAASLADRLDVDGSTSEHFVGEFGPVMVLHTGVGLAGVAWWWERTVGSGASSSISEW